jgi:hypothetical protein
MGVIRWQTPLGGGRVKEYFRKTLSQGTRKGQLAGEETGGSEELKNFSSRILYFARMVFLQTRWA